MRMITPLEAVSHTYGILLFGWAVQICYMYRLPVNSNTACVPHTPYTLVLKFVPPAGGLCGAATHMIGGVQATLTISIFYLFFSMEVQLKVIFSE